MKTTTAGRECKAARHLASVGPGVDLAAASERPAVITLRDPEHLHPHPVYQELRAPIVTTYGLQGARRAGLISEPLLTTVDGTILDGHVRWQLAIERQQRTLPCLEYDLSDEEALQVVIQRHWRSAGLNDYGRIVMALNLESYFRERRPPTPSTERTRPSSKLTNRAPLDVRRDIAEVAGVSAGNVTKVKQLLNTAIEEVRERLLRGELSIHRAWQWRTLSPKGQRDALWAHLHQGGIKKTVERLVRAHVDAGAPPQPDKGIVAMLGELTMYDAADIVVAVVDIPGRAVVLTRTCYDELHARYTQ